MLIILISFLSYGQSGNEIAVRINCEHLDSSPKFFIIMDENEYFLDSIPSSINPNWIEKIEVLKSGKQKYIYGNKNGIVVIYPQRRYFNQLNLLLETTPNTHKHIYTNQPCESVDVASTKLNHPVKSKVLLAEIDKLINYRDSLTENANYDITNSFWIYFSKKDSLCFVTLLVQPLDIYDREEMDGYFIYKDRFISVYDSKIECNTDFIDSQLLRTGEIPDLLNYWSDTYSENESFPPHNCYGHEYLIINRNKLKLISKGHHLGRPLPAKRIPPKPIYHETQKTD